jgi:hypothetical protein
MTISISAIISQTTATVITTTTATATATTTTIYERIVLMKKLTMTTMETTV